MADSKLTALSAGTAVGGTDLFYSSQSATSVKITGTQIKTWTSASPALVTPNLGTPTAGVLSSCSAYPLSALTGAGTGVLTALAVNVGSAGAPVVFNGALGTPSSGTLTSCTGLPVSTGISGLGTGVPAFLTTPSSANLATAVTDETGTGALVFGTSPTISTKLTITGATETTSNPVIDATQTWNSSGVTFTGVKLNVTSTASATASMLADLQVGSVSAFSVRKDGALTISGASSDASYIFGTAQFRTGSILIGFNSYGGASFANGAGSTVYGGVGTPGAFITSALQYSWTSGAGSAGLDTGLKRGSAGVVTATDGSTGVGYYKTTGVAVGSLPSAATVGAGTRGFVTDALTTLALGLGTTVANGGSNKVPVYSDGTNWLYG